MSALLPQEPLDLCGNLKVTNYTGHKSRLELASFPPWLVFHFGAKSEAGDTVGRKSKLTEELVLRAVELISQGNYVSTVCAHLGIGESTWYRWMEQGEQANRGRYREFWEAIKKAETEAEIQALRGVLAAGKTNWQAYAWYLERKFPDKYGRRERLEADVSHSGQVSHEHDYKSELIEAILEDEEASQRVKEHYRQRAGAKTSS